MTREKSTASGINSIVFPLIVGFIIWGVLFLRYGFFYDLNDDVLIKDILSGIYTGSIDIHNMQMLAPVSLVLCALYKLMPFVPWMGMLEVFLMFTCFLLIGQRTHEVMEIRITDPYRRRITLVLFYIALACVAAGLFLWEIVMVQYTVVCGLLVATAAYMFYMDESSVFELKNHCVSVIFVVIAFNIRSEMTLLLFPFLAVVLLSRWVKDGFFHITNKKYIKFVVIVIAGMLISYGGDKVAYGSEEWKEFVSFFNARTEVYDFTGIPSYEENISFYNQEEVSESDYEALVTYNYEFSQRVNTELLNAIAEYSKSQINTFTKYKQILRAGLNSIVYMFSFDTPGKQMDKTILDNGFMEDSRSYGVQGIVVVIMYIACIVMAFTVKDKSLLVKVLFLFVMRSVSWTYIIYRGRINTRIANPLYLIELLILVSLMVMTLFDKQDELKKRRCQKAYLILFVTFIMIGSITACFVHNQVKILDKKVEVRNTKNELCKAMYAYTESKPRNYYYLDVYSSVDFTEKIWTTTKYQKANVQLAGGWISKSPLDTEKRSHYTDETKWYFITENDYGYEKKLVDEIITEDESQKLYVYEF